jgi:hypothetical protein
MGVCGTVSRGCRLPCRTTSHSGGDGLTGELAEQCRGVIPRHIVDSFFTRAPVNVSALNAPVGGAGMDIAGP